MYGNVAEFKSYHTSRGRLISPNWSDEYITAALLVASEWIDNKYGVLFSGQKTDGFSQTREWPRQYASTNETPIHIFEETDIPQRVVDATYEATFREATKSGALNVDFTPNKYNRVSVSEAVNADYTRNQTIQDRQVQIQIISQLMRPLVDPAKQGGSNNLSGNVNRI